MENKTNQTKKVKKEYSKGITKMLEVKEVKTQKNKKKFLELMEKNLSNVSKCCKAVGIYRATYYVWLEKDKEFAKRIEELEEDIIDFAESSLYKQIDKGNTQATQILLRAKAKQKGYIEESKLNLTGEQNLNINFNIPRPKEDKKSDDE